MLVRSKTLTFIAVGIAVVGIAALTAKQLTAHHFSDRSLRGKYRFNLVEIRDETPPGSPVPVLDRCDEFGILNFDGAGTVTASSTRRCSVSGNATSAGVLLYSVSPDGSFTITEPGGGQTDHGQILLAKRLLLLDGTTRTDPQVMIHHGVAAKRWLGR